MQRAMLALAAVLFVTTGCATAQTVVAVEGPAQPAVWAVRDTDSTMYFYGAIHLRKAGASWAGPVAERALAESQDVWTEIEFDPAQDAALQGVVARYGFDASRTLSSQLDPARAFERFK